MFNLIDVILVLFLASFLEWYRNTFLTGFTQFPTFFLSIILTYIVIQLFFIILPPLRKLMIILAFPFHYMHVWLHVDAARRLSKQKKEDITKKQASINLRTQWWGKDNALISLEVYTRLDTFKIASAPFIGAFSLLLFIILSSPILARSGLVGLLIHIYLIFCCFGVALPSLSDYSYIFQGVRTQSSSIAPGYFLWVYFIFAISGYITLKRTDSPISAFFDGTIFSVIYLVGLLIIAVIFKPQSENETTKLHFFRN
ncbi:MAG: hypothetical protein ACFFCQ_13175 [Promethearchaeota archaeon]